MITTMTVVTEQLILGMYLQFTVDQKWRKVTLQHLSTTCITDCHLQRRPKKIFYVSFSHDKSQSKFRGTGKGVYTKQINNIYCRNDDDI